MGIITTLLASLFQPGMAPPALALDVPTLLTPANSSKITAAVEADSVQSPPMAIPEFSWTADPEATQYKLQLSQDIGFNSSIEFNTPHTRYTPVSVSSLPDGIWYWRVRVESPTVGSYSSIWSFTKQWASPNNFPALNSPAANATLEFYDSPTFSWQPVIGAAYYRLQMSTAPEFAVVLYNQNTIATTLQPYNKLPNGTYYWRVIPFDPVGRTGTSSEIRRFDLGYNQVPTLLTPADDSFPTFTPTFRWTAVRGATYYRLEYSTDPSFNSGITQIDTYNTTYTPNITLPNDVNHYWRVRAQSGDSISNWSPTWSFIKQWYIQPELLTPVNLYQQVRFPFFSWAPVPGAYYYRVEVDYDIDFINPYLSETTSNPFYMPRVYDGSERINYWRVIPYDHNNNQGLPSTPSSYLSSYDFNAPQQIYPLYYYPPNSFPPPDENVNMNPYEDRTVPLPIFIWQRVTVPWPTGGLYASAYRIEVSSDPLFLQVDWTEDTENTYATPTAANPFVPIDNFDYYWRICPLDTLEEYCLMTDPPDSVEWMSQVWRTRFDSSLMLAPTTNTAPQLIRPLQAAEFVEGTPLFEWLPKSGADSYEIQISDEPTFAAPIDSAIVPYPAYAPKEVLAQRDLLNRLDYGTYYWRVRARSGGTPFDSWSSIWRFQVASQSHWIRTRTLGDVSNQLQIAADSMDAADTNYELTTLQAAQDIDKWYFGFHATATATNMTYALYIDLDHVNGSGGNVDPRGFSITTIPAHQPEFVVYIFQIGGGFSAAQTAVYAWNGSSWNTPQTLASMVGGGLSYVGGYLEIRVPNTAIGMDLTTGSYALSLVSLPYSSGAPLDSVPSDPNVPGSGQLSRFASVSARMTPLTPPSNAEGDPATYSSIPPFFWENPTGWNGTTPWAGAKMEVKLDPQFTSASVANFDLESNAPYYASTVHAWPWDFIGDNTYYWRIQPRYLDAVGVVYGPWSQGMRFERQGFTPQNLQESVTFATPTFTWDMVEGADYYELQVDNDPGFGSLEINESTPQNTYTPRGTLANATYYWRVRTRRYNGVTNEWSAVKSFTLALPVPQGLTPNDPDELNVVGTTPTLCWTALLVADNGTPVLAATRYRIQVSRGDPTFSAIYDSADTEQNCWTPTKGYDDGKYYWHVAMIDGQGRQGDYSPAAELTKQYPRAIPQSPASGSAIANTPTFTWTAVDGVTPYVFGAASYRLEISQFPTFSPTYEVVTTPNTRYTPPYTYQTGKTYYWRIAIIDVDGKVGPFSDATIILDPNAGMDMLFLPILVSD